jgi:hypothetical protein
MSNRGNLNAVIMLGGLMTALLGAAPARTEDGGCKALFDALKRQATTPNHQYFTQSTGTPGTKSELSEIINTGTARYLLLNGKWQSVPESPQAMLQREEENQKNSKSNCRLLREELVDGVSTRVYSEHSETGEAKSDGLIWIAKGTGLPVRQRIDVDSGNGPAGSRHVEIRVVYSGVAAPAGVE